MQVRRILFPINFSDQCRGAAHYVRAFAGRFGAEVIVAHASATQHTVFGIPEVGILPDEAGTAHVMEQKTLELNNFIAEELQNLNVTAKVKHGDPASVILRLSRELAPDLLMMPTHGFGPFRRFLIGSVTAKVLHDSHCPVWTGVHMEDAPPPDRIRFDKILCAVDVDRETGIRTLSAAADLARQTGADVVIVHAIPALETRPEQHFDAQFQTFLRKVADDEIEAMQKAAGTQFRVCIYGGPVAKVVRDAALNHSADLVMAGRGSHDLLGRLRTHGYAIVRDSPCPVISV
jgi:nucleotide-binding universal stress UspA family protein